MIRLSIISKFFAVITFCMISFSSYGQDNCAMTLKKAEKLFDDGKIEEIPGMLQLCIDNGFDKAQKKRAYELIIQSYITEDNRKMADEYMIKLLKLDPNYQSEKTVVSTDFTALISEIEAEPVFTFGLRAGLNVSQVALIEQFGVHDLERATGEYSSNAGFQVGIQLSKTIFKDLELAVDPMFVQQSYDYKLNNAFDFSNISYTENLSCLDFPVYLTYKFDIKKFSPYIKLGFQPSVLLSAQIQANREYTDNSHNNLSSSNIDVSGKREDVNFYAVFGIGVRYRIDKGYIVFDATYNKGLNNTTLESERYADSELIYNYYIVDDDKYLNSFSFNLGYSYSIFKPKKAKVQ